MKNIFGILVFSVFSTTAALALEPNGGGTVLPDGGGTYYNGRDSEGECESCKSPHSLTRTDHADYNVIRDSQEAPATGSQKNKKGDR